MVQVVIQWRRWLYKHCNYSYKLQGPGRGLTNTTITVLRVPASVSEYGWMLEKRHFVYM